MDIRKYSRYASLFHKPGIINDSITGMEWMESDYDFRTLKEVTELCSILEFLNELLTILTIGTPNLMMLGHSLGVFDWRNNALLSKEIFNKLISEIVMYPLNSTTAYKDELGRITIKFAKPVLQKHGVRKSLALHKINIDREDNFDLTTIPIIVKRFPLSEDINMIVKVKMKNDWVNMIDIWYE